MPRPIQSAKKLWGELNLSREILSKGTGQKSRRSLGQVRGWCTSIATPEGQERNAALGGMQGRDKEGKIATGRSRATKGGGLLFRMHLSVGEKGLQSNKSQLNALQGVN